MKWEYRVMQVGFGDLEEFLNGKGASGWELVQVLVTEMDVRVVLKRPVQETPA